MRVAGTAALLVAKLHKIGERAYSAPGRLIDKDAHDVYRILADAPTDRLAVTLIALAGDQLAGKATRAAIRPKYCVVHVRLGRVSQGRWVPLQSRNAPRLIDQFVEHGYQSGDPGRRRAPHDRHTRAR